MEALAVSAEVQKKFYGDMPIEVGYCNGRNTTWNGFEYHKGSEINVAVTDFMLILGHVWQIEDNTYRFENAKVFFVPKGTAVEMYQTTLHLSPCRVCDAGFKGVVILPRARTPRWTRRPLTATRRASCCSSETSGSLHTRSGSRSSSRALTPPAGREQGAPLLKGQMAEKGQPWRSFAKTGSLP